MFLLLIDFRNKSIKKFITPIKKGDKNHKKYKIINIPLKK